jgi:hypothetical protein
MFDIFIDKRYKPVNEVPESLLVDRGDAGFSIKDAAGEGRPAYLDFQVILAINES